VVLIDGRDEVWRRMRADGIEVQVGTFALHREPAFRDGRCRFVGDLAGSRSAFERSLCLPLFHDMTSGEQERVVAALRELL
jgi:dTDP-4-amino-4,6-dideoxygalactose transaminase